ncbi:MAG TPA: hypothetical protein VGK94_00490 [Candidatus Polarisedimenticolia bacterium]|jgi:hypothetical protein
MSELSHGDRYLARLLSKPPYRRSLYTIFVLSATADLYFRVWLGRSEQALPWYGALLSVYGLVVAPACRDRRCRAVYLAFSVLIAALFTRRLLAEWTRPVGVLEVLCCVVLVVCLASLARDAEFLAVGVRGTPEPDGPPARSGPEA